jgi:exosortase
LQVALLAAIGGVLAYFYCFYNVFMSGHQSLGIWSIRGWNEPNDLEHGWLVFPAAAYAVWWRRAELAAAPKSSSLLGLGILLLGVGMFVISVRTLQPRYGQVSIPVVLYGGVRYLWGRQTARLLIFPCVFLLFIIPVGFLVQRTVGLQTMTASVASWLARHVGVGVVNDGAKLHALDGSFDFEVVGGCSGIRSLTAMAMLGALYVYFTQREMWKKLLIFASSMAFALLGNLVRIFSVVVCAKVINPKIAGSVYHDYSGFIFFPIAVGAMVGFSNLLNRDWSDWKEVLLTPQPLARTPAAGAKIQKPAAKGGEKAAANPVSYDY